MNDLIAMRDWLANPEREFKTGLDFYNKYKSNPKLDSFFASALSNPSATAVNMLMQKISQICLKIQTNPAYLEKVAQKTVTQSINPVIGTPKTPTKIVKAAKRDINNLPDELKPHGKRIQEITLELGAIHAKMKAEQDKDKAAELLKDLKALDAEKRRLWAIVDGEDKNDFTDGPDQNQTPIERIAAIVISPERLEAIAVRRKNITDSIAKKQKEMETVANHPAKLKKKKESIARYEEELTQLQKLEDETRSAAQA